MNHQRVYESIIKKTKSENRKKLNHTDGNFVYYEKHHILPRCVNGTDDKKNLVLLTAKEHYVCHKLLTYIYKGNRKIACAFHFMSFSTKHNELVSSKDFQYAKELISSTPVSIETRKKLSISLTGRPFAKKGISISKEHKEKISISNSEENNGMYDKKHTPESIEKNRKSNTGKKRSAETKLKMIKSQTGRKHTEETKLKMQKSWELRKINSPMSEITKKKMSESKKGNTLRLGKKHTEETKEKISLSKTGHLLGPQSLETINKRLLSKKGYKHSEKTKLKISKSVTGKRKILPKKICPYCQKEYASHIIKRFHGENCKSKS